MKYRPRYPDGAFASVKEAQAWVDEPLAMRSTAGVLTAQVRRFGGLGSLRGFRKVVWRICNPVWAVGA